MNDLVLMKDIIEKHGLKRYIVIRQTLSNRHAVVIDHALSTWERHANTRKFCIPFIFIALGNYYDNKYTTVKKS